MNARLHLFLLQCIKHLVDCSLLMANIIFFLCLELLVLKPCGDSLLRSCLQLRTSCLLDLEVSHVWTILIGHVVTVCMVSDCLDGLCVGIYHLLVSVLC